MTITDDEVVLAIEGETLTVAESYEVAVSILDTPAAFSLTLGSSATAKDILAKALPNAQFTLSIGGVLQQTGRIDGAELNFDGPTTVTIHGRDALAPLHDAYVENDVSFKSTTYADMTLSAMQTCGVDGALIYDNFDNRSKTAGASIGTQVAAAITTVAKSASSGPIQAKVGERWMEFLRGFYARAGLALWAAADGSLILSAPNTSQPPTYAIARQRGAMQNAVNVVGGRWRNVTTRRHSEAIVYGRGGGKKFGRTKSTARITDAEMGAYGFQRPLVLRDVDAKDQQQAERLAFRALADERREGWALEYKIAGHRLPLVAGGDAIVVPDTMVQVRDDEAGLNDTYYLVGVTYARQPETTCSLTLVRPNDLILAES